MGPVLHLLGIRPLRVMINQSALDVLYYHDPRCCQQILDEMCKNMTQMYTTFLSRHRGFEARGGKVCGVKYIIREPNF